MRRGRASACLPAEASAQVGAQGFGRADVFTGDVGRVKCKSALLHFRAEEGDNWRKRLWCRNEPVYISARIKPHSVRFSLTAHFNGAILNACRSDSYGKIFFGKGK
ncbi:hypothetical protein A3H74_04070 [Candidatus Kaiserbacteria bacterium RIFCSPLOWO2_02_FULL_51_13]|uniref:Uncharacterized protein n=1 Tax=Candidatus Kaiserbacteria bacterium RIFCSPLOWO2_01_FULL_50_24 TaxID=1798507 RepID=A0A1F6EP65_9BACT|nr:MAG: hypothetical protein A3A34_02240 [Candidatus Kaiserbacteria bacterium RIFCSPLOWO2_01_FULL_50_24]OGG81069.1 MAG: hypothetical protein A3H74_04070 [Candidatus Kaiserbacteria bacterium RIFCSPLOWO2_02_FULL_51_13]